MSERRKFSAAFKAQVVLEVISGAKTAAEVCREHQLSPKTFSGWKQKFLDNAARIFASPQDRDVDAQRIAELERMVGKLIMQLEVSKKASNILTSHRARNAR